MLFKIQYFIEQPSIYVKQHLNQNLDAKYKKQYLTLPWFITFEKAIELKVILVAIDNDSVGLVVAEEQFWHVSTVSQGTVEDPCQGRADLVLIAVVLV